MPGTFDELTGTARLVDGERDESGAGAGESGAVANATLPDAGAPPEPVSSSERTPQQIREVAKELTRYGLIEAIRKPNLYRVLQNQQRAIAAILEPLDLDLAIDDVRGIAFVTVRSEVADSEFSAEEEVDPDEWSHPLVRRQRLTLEQSLLVAILRQHFVAHEQEAGIGADDARVAVDELIPQFQIYLGDPGSEAKERTRMLTLLDQLKGHGLVSEPDTHERVTIRPIIAHLASPENLQHLLSWLRQRRTGESDGEAQTTATTAASTTMETVLKPNQVAGGATKKTVASVLPVVPAVTQAQPRESSSDTSTIRTEVAEKTEAAPVEKDEADQMADGVLSDSGGKHSSTTGSGQTGELFGEQNDTSGRGE